MFLTCGHSSVVERLVANEKVEGSTPFARSNNDIVIMIIWIVSYPKSGNTYLRSFLASYYYSLDGKFQFDQLAKIPQFPNMKFAKVKSESNEEASKNWLFNQNEFFKKKDLTLVKTHNCLYPFKGNIFTSINEALGAIYIVRDPRNIVTSLANFLDISTTRATDHLIQSSYIGGISNSNKIEDIMKTYTGTWGSNFNSWKSFKSNRKYLLIKYEDLISNKEENFKKILKFIYKLKNINFQIDETKIKNVIQSTSFENMKNLEKEKGFEEARINVETKEKIPFFNLGPKNEWKKLLDLEIVKKIEKAFKKEMKELEYL